MKHVGTAFLWMAVLFSLLACPARADIVRPLPGGSGVSEGLTATGHAEAKAKPDIAYIDLRIITQSRDQAEAVRANSIRVKGVTDVLKKSTIADGDIATDQYTVQPQYDYQANPPVLTAYQVITSLHVTIRLVAKAGVITDKAVNAGATEVGGLTYDVADKHKIQGDVLVAAVADARSKADLMAGAAGVQVGRLLSLSESTPALVQPLMMAGVRTQAASGTPDTSFLPQDITVTADVTAVFSIDSSK